MDFCKKCGERAPISKNVAKEFEGLCYQCIFIMAAPGKPSPVKWRMPRQEHLKRRSARQTTNEIYGKASRFKCVFHQCLNVADEWHHPDYCSPLEVVSVCHFHHGIFHVKNKK